MGAFATVRARVALTLANFAEKIASPGVLKRAPRTLSGVDGSGRGWMSLFSTWGNGGVGFQNDTVPVDETKVVAQVTVFACMTLISSDIGKLRAKLMQQLAGIWQEITSNSFSPVLRKPNRFQTWQKFIEQWILSLLSNGNTYVLKVRDGRGVVAQLYVLDPTRCRPLVAPDGSVYYALQEDDLSTVSESMPAVPASEIIHDRINCLFHPLVGLSPLFACGLAATKGLEIENNATRFFANQSQPGGVLTAPGEIGEENAVRLKEYFEREFTGDNAGRVAVLGDGLKYEPMTTNAVDAQLVEQLKWSAEQICACFHVPAYLVGAAAVPPNNNVEALRLDYYGRCLQTLIEGIENALDEGLGLLGPMSDGKVLGVELDLDGLLRMDTTSLTTALKEQVTAGITSPNEARRRLNLPPVTGGESPLAQQQNYSLSALAKRDASADPFGKASAPAAPPAPPSDAAAEAAKGVAESFERMSASFLKALPTPAERDEEARAATAQAKAAAEAAAAEASALEERIAATELFTREADRVARAAAAEQLDAIKAMAEEMRAEREAQAARAEAAEKAAREAEDMTAAFCDTLVRRLELEPACG